jgi:hypothetical protein
LILWGSGALSAAISARWAAAEVEVEFQLRIETGNWEVEHHFVEVASAPLTS